MQKDMREQKRAHLYYPTASLSTPYTNFESENASNEAVPKLQSLSSMKEAKRERKVSIQSKQLDSSLKQARFILSQNPEENVTPFDLQSNGRPSLKQAEMSATRQSLPITSSGQSLFQTANAVTTKPK